MADDPLKNQDIIDDDPDADPFYDPDRAFDQDRDWEELDLAWAAQFWARWTFGKFD